MLLYTPPHAAKRIPVIDLEPSFSGNPEHRITTANEIHKAARETGFFYVKNHRIDPSLVDCAFEQAKRFFALPLEQKLDLKITVETPRGYERLEGQVLDVGSTAPDLKEGFLVAGDPAPGAPTVAGALSDTLANRWPSGLPGFREGVLNYYAPMCDLGLHLMRLLALSLDMPEDFFDEPYRFSNPRLRMHHYPPQPADAAFNQIGAGAHTDWGAITLLAQDDCGGLEVENAAHEWLRGEPVPGTFVINLGDMVSRWTNGLYHSNMHRVMNDSGRDRYSIVLFYNPKHHTRVECLPTCLPADGKPAYEPCTAGEHLDQMRMLTLRA
jgi:isopenicillin N synthase-like dioxygenase